MKTTALLNVTFGRESNAPKFADGVLRGVHLLGFKSKNGRGYTREAVQAAVPLYNRVKVFSDHKEDRSVNDLIGHIENPRYEAASGNYGDLVLNPKHPRYEQYAWMAEHQSDIIGMSHEAGLVMESDGRTVRRIANVASVDLVVNPATVKGLFESMKVTENVTDRKNLVDIAAWAAHDAIRQATQPTETLSQEADMELKDLTIDSLRTGRADLVTAIEAAAVKAAVKPAVDAALARESAVQKALAKLPAVLRTASIEKIVRATESTEIDALVADLAKTVKADLAKTVKTTESAETGDEEEVITGGRESAAEGDEVAATEAAKAKGKKGMDLDRLLALAELRD